MIPSKSCSFIVAALGADSLRSTSVADFSNSAPLISPATFFTTSVSIDRLPDAPRFPPLGS